MGGENDLKAVELLTLREEGEGEEEEERWGRLGPLGFYGPTDTHARRHRFEAKASFLFQTLGGTRAGSADLLISFLTSREGLLASREGLLAGGGA